MNQRKTAIKQILFLSLTLFLVSGFSQNVEWQFSRKSPRDAMRSFRYFQDKETYNLTQASRVIPIFNNRKKAEELTEKLKQIFDGKGVILKSMSYPNDPNYIDSLTGQQVFTPSPLVLPDVYLVKMGSEWYFSNHTVKKIPILHEEIYAYGLNSFMGIKKEPIDSKKYLDWNF